MTTKLQKAEALADAVREIRRLLVSPDSDLNIGDAISECDKTLKSFDEAATEQGPEPSHQQKLIGAYQLAKDFRSAWDAKDEDTFWEKFDEACLSLTALEQLAAQPPQPEAKPERDELSELREKIRQLNGDLALEKGMHEITTEHANSLRKAAREEAKPGDGMRAAVKDLWDNTYYTEEEALAVIAKHHAHCPNAAGDAREVSAKELIAWVKSFSYKSADSLRDRYDDHVSLMEQYLTAFIQAERAKASQTP